MLLMTKEMKAAMPPLYSSEETPFEDKVVVAKFFNPYGPAYWLVVEGSEQEDGDWLLFGYADMFGDCGEWGYFSLREIQALDTGIGGMERDIHHTPCPFSKFNGRYAAA